MRTKRVWTLADLAWHVWKEKDDSARRRALRLVQRLERAHGVTLLTPTTGSNRCFTVRPAALQRLDPALFESVETMEIRVDGLEERIEKLLAENRALQSTFKTIAGRLRAHDRAIWRLQGERPRRVA